MGVVLTHPQFVEASFARLMKNNTPANVRAFQICLDAHVGIEGKEGFVDDEAEEAGEAGEAE